MKEQVLLLSTDRWEMTDEKTRETNSGVSLWYINDYREDTRDALGYKPTKISAPTKVFEQLKAVPLPCLAEITYTTKPGAGGKASLMFLDIKPLKEVKIF